MDYAPKIFRTLASYDYAPLRVETDTGESVEGAHLFVFNIPQYGGGLHDAGLCHESLPTISCPRQTQRRPPLIGPSAGQRG